MGEQGAVVYATTSPEVEALDSDDVVTTGTAVIEPILDSMTPSEKFSGFVAMAA